MNKKGFTLIELLAVIVILAVIALIVTPIVTGIIAQAKESANARSVEGHIKDMEYAMLEVAFKDGTGNTSAFNNLTTYETITGALSDKGVTPSNDLIKCATYTVSEGTITAATGCTATGWGKTYKFVQGNNAQVEPAAPAA